MSHWAVRYPDEKVFGALEVLHLCSIHLSLLSKTWR